MYASVQRGVFERVLVSRLSFAASLSVRSCWSEAPGETYQSPAIASVSTELALGHWRTLEFRIRRGRRSCDRGQSADGTPDLLHAYDAHRADYGPCLLATRVGCAEHGCGVPTDDFGDRTL